MYIFNIYFKPFEDPGLNKIEIFNELCILCNGYHLILLTDFLPSNSFVDAERITVGYSMIGITAINIAVNTAIMFWKSIQRLRLVISYLKARFTRWRENKWR